MNLPANHAVGDTGHTTDHNTIESTLNTHTTQISGKLDTATAASTYLTQTNATSTYLAVLAVAAPTGVAATDTAAIQNALNTATFTSPVWIVLQPGTYKIDTALVVPKSPGTKITGSGRDVTYVQQQTAGQAVLRFTTGDTHSIVMEDLTLEYASAQTNAASQAVTYEGIAGESYYHHRYNRVRIRNAYDCWAIVNASGSPVSVWDMHWTDCDHFATKHRVASFAPVSAVGMPAVHWTRVVVSNTGGGPTPTSAAFFTQACELTVDGLDIEGWDNEIANVTGGGGATFNDVHVESHTMSTGERLIYFSDSRLIVSHIGVSGTAAGTSGHTALVEADNGSVKIDGVRTALTVSAGDFAVCRAGTAIYEIGSVQTDSGTTPTLWGAVTTVPDQVWYPASAWKDAAGSPTFAGNAVGSRFPGWELADGVTQQIDIGFSAPPKWKTFDVVIYWANTSAASGSVSFGSTYSHVAAGGDLTTGDVASPIGPTTALAQNVLATTAFYTGISATPGVYHIRMNRAGADGSDTLAGTIAVLGMMLNRAS